MIKKDKIVMINNQQQEENFLSRQKIKDHVIC
jgi:hypothetical protein